MARHPEIRFSDPDRPASFYTSKNVQKRAEKARQVSLAVEVMRNLAEQGLGDVEASEQLLEIIADPQADGATIRSLSKYLYDADEDADEQGILPDGAMSVLSLAGLLDKEWAGSAVDQRLIGASAKTWSALAARAAKLARGEGAVLTPALAEILDGALNAITRRRPWDNFYSHWPLPGDEERVHALAAIRKTPAGAPLGKLLEWIEEHVDPKDLSWLQDCSYPAVVEAVADRSPAASSANGVEALAKGGRIDAIARNPHLSEDGKNKLLDIFIERIRDRSNSEDTEYLGEEIEARGWRFNTRQMTALRNIVIAGLTDEEGEDSWADEEGARPAERISYISQAITEDRAIHDVMADSRNPVIQTRIFEVSKGNGWLKSMAILAEIDQEDSKTLNRPGHHMEMVVPHTEDWQVEGLSEKDLISLVAHTNEQVRMTGRRLMIVVNKPEPKNKQVLRTRAPR